MATRDHASTGDSTEAGPGLPGHVAEPIRQPLSPRGPARQPSRWGRNGVLLIAIAAAIALGFTWSALQTRALAATAFAARTVCVCRHVSGLGLESCGGTLAVAGLGRMTALVRISEDAPVREVTASVPFLASQSARFAPATGCQLEPWAP